MKSIAAVLFLLFINQLEVFPYNYSAYLKFMYKPSKYSINEILIENLENKKEVKIKLIKYYLEQNNLLKAEYHVNKLKANDENSCIVKARFYIKKNNYPKATDFLKKALFKFNSQQAFHILENLNSVFFVKDFANCIKKAFEINPSLVNYYYHELKKCNIPLKKLIINYIIYSENPKISEKDFKKAVKNPKERIYYLEKLIKRRKYEWAEKLLKKILFKNPYLINIRRILILNLR